MRRIESVSKSGLEVEVREDFLSAGFRTPTRVARVRRIGRRGGEGWHNMRRASIATGNLPVVQGGLPILQQALFHASGTRQAAVPALVALDGAGRGFLHSVGTTHTPPRPDLPSALPNAVYSTRLAPDNQAVPPVAVLNGAGRGFFTRLAPPTPGHGLIGPLGTAKRGLFHASGTRWQVVPPVASLDGAGRGLLHAVGTTTPHRPLTGPPSQPRSMSGIRHQCQPMKTS